jgi:hypothetical protein
VLAYDPLPWLMAEKGLPAIRARRLLGLRRDDDDGAVSALEKGLAKAQLREGSFEHSPMKTAGTLELLDDLRAKESSRTMEMAAAYLFSVLQSQPGYEQAREVKPGSLRTPCDLCGFFGPYEDRARPAVMKWGAREMNFYREYEPLLGPKSRIRSARRSSLDRAGPSSCYSWGLIPLSYVVEALCSAGFEEDERIKPAINALLGAQRESGGWCRNVGTINTISACTIHVLRALGAHAALRRSEYALRALELLRSVQMGDAKARRGWDWATLQAAIPFDLPVAMEIIRDALATFAPHQRRNGTFGGPCEIERVATVLLALKKLDGARPS